MSGRKGEKPEKINEKWETLSGIVRSAFASNNNFAISVCPCQQALWRGVSPSLNNKNITQKQKEKVEKVR